MVDERELWVRASEFMTQHGSVAWLTAALRAEELLDQGEMEGNRTFLLILDKIALLEAQTTNGRTH